MKIVVFGKNGMVAKALHEALPNALFFGRNECDISSSYAVKRLLSQEKPDIIINAAAYTDVGGAEHNKDECYKVNTLAPKEMAKWAGKTGALLLHISSDYAIDPINYYGETKRKADDYIRRLASNFYIIRTSAVYSHCGSNFLQTMVGLSKEKTNIEVNKQECRPTYAPDLAEHIEDIVTSYDKTPRQKIYDFASSELTTFDEWAKLILEEYDKLGYKIQSRSLDPSLKKPEKCLLLVDDTYPSHKDSLKTCLRRIKK